MNDDEPSKDLENGKEIGNFFVIFMISTMKTWLSWGWFENFPKILALVRKISNPYPKNIYFDPKKKY